jgi:hypothetical protein
VKQRAEQKPAAGPNGGASRGLVAAVIANDPPRHSPHQGASQGFRRKKLRPRGKRRAPAQQQNEDIFHTLNQLFRRPSTSFIRGSIYRFAETSHEQTSHQPKQNPHHAANCAIVPQASLVQQIENASFSAAVPSGQPRIQNLDTLAGRCPKSEKSSGRTLGGDF